MHRARLIRVHGLLEGMPTLISVDHIMLIGQKDGQEGCTLLLSSQQYLDVRESQDEVAAQFEGN